VASHGLRRWLYRSDSLYFDLFDIACVSHLRLVRFLIHSVSPLCSLSPQTYQCFSIWASLSSCSLSSKLNYPPPSGLHPASFSFACWVPYVLRPFTVCLCDVALCPDQSVLALIFLSRILHSLVWVLICPGVLRSQGSPFSKFRSLTTCSNEFWKNHISCLEFTNID
jgi:hypothetical protein